MSGKVIRQKLITRDEVRAKRNTIFVFGDNMVRQGFGGQAGQMRGEPNAIGIPTKWTYYKGDRSYFTDADLPQVKKIIDSDFGKLKELKKRGHDIIIPENGLGTGLAQLPTRAPKILEYINQKIAELEES